MHSSDHYYCKSFGRAIAATLALAAIRPAAANYARVTESAIAAGRASADATPMEFAVAWDSWRDDRNHDALWVFFKVSEDEKTWRHATLSEAGVNPRGFSTGSGGGDYEIFVPEDRKGLFLRRSASNRGRGPTELKNVRALWDAAADNFRNPGEARVRTLAIEMVYVPRGPFWVGDTVSDNRFTQTRIVSDDPTVTAARIPEGQEHAGRWAGGRPRATAAPAPGYPNGYAAFYCMKYELTQGTYAAFIELLTDIQKRRHHPPADRRTMGGYVARVLPHSSFWDTRVRDAGGHGFFPQAMISWDNLSAFFDWAALRPMTELEFEKACRGPLFPVPGEFAWGTTKIVQQTGHANDPAITSDDLDQRIRDFAAGRFDGTETAAPANANANFGAGVHRTQKYNVGNPVRVGIYAATGKSDTREDTGASYWGVFELSGNMYERTIRFDDRHGRLFDGRHGDGALERGGRPNVPGWPDETGRGVMNRGGAHSDATTHPRHDFTRFYEIDANHLRVSHRTMETQHRSYIDNWHYHFGGRGVRTAH